MDALAVEKCAPSSFRSEFILAGNVENDARAQDPVTRDRDRYGILRVPMQEIGGAVERIGDYDDSLARDRGKPRPRTLLLA